MKLDIEPAGNGWIVQDLKTNKRMVFVDREKLMEHLNSIIPPTGEEQKFIDCIDGSEKKKKTMDEYAERMNDIFGQIKNGFNKTDSDDDCDEEAFDELEMEEDNVKQLLEQVKHGLVSKKCANEKLFRK